MHNIYVNMHIENRHLIYSLIHSFIFIFSCLNFIHLYFYLFNHSFTHLLVNPSNHLFNRLFLNIYYVLRIALGIDLGSRNIQILQCKYIKKYIWLACHKIHLLKMHNLMTFEYMHSVQSFYSRTFSWLPKETVYLLVITAKPLQIGRAHVWTPVT